MKKFDLAGRLGGLVGKKNSQDNQDQDGFFDRYDMSQEDMTRGGYPQQRNTPPQYDARQGGYPQQRNKPPQYDPRQGGYPLQQQNTPPQYDARQGSYQQQMNTPPQYDARHGGYPQQQMNNPPQYGAQQGGYPQDQFGQGYPEQDFDDGFYDQPQQQRGRKNSFDAAKLISGIGSSVGGMIGKAKQKTSGSVSKLKSRLSGGGARRVDTDEFDNSFGGETASRTAGLSDVQRSELGGDPIGGAAKNGSSGSFAPSQSAGASAGDLFDDDLFDDDFDIPKAPARVTAKPATPAAPGQAGRQQRFSRRTEQAAQASPSGESAATEDRINYKYTPDFVYDQHRDDVGYVPPLSAAPYRRSRYRRRNRTPMKMWVKASLTALTAALCFAVIISLIFVSMITSRVNYTGDSLHNTVYLSVQEKRALSQEETSVEENETEFTVPAISERSDKDVKVILLIASDQLFASGKSSNCDALMLLVVDNRYKQIKLVSIMSELYVRIPGYYSNTLGKAFYYDTAKGDYSLSILRQTIEDNFRLSIDNYVVVDYKALETLVNRLGGVSLELTPEEADYMRSDPKYGLFPRFTYGGMYNMSGAETLNFIRMKKVGDGAFERTSRQRRVLYELIGKIQDLSFIELSELTYAMLPLLGTNMTKSDVLYYFNHARSISQYPIDQLRIPIEGSFRFGEANVLGQKFEVLVTNYAFTSEAIRDYIYENDATYQGGAYATDVVLPEVAPPPELPEEEPAASPES